jgi:hypothetical protein
MLSDMPSTACSLSYVGGKKKSLLEVEEWWLEIGKDWEEGKGW